MRPESLYPLFKEVAGLSGIGAGTAKLLARLEIMRVVDLLFDLPTGQIERVALADVQQARADMQVVLALDVVEHLPTTSPRAPWRVACLDARGTPVLLIFFASAAHYIPRQLKVGQRYLVAGKLELFGGRWQISHPERIQPQESAEAIPLRESVYRLTAGLSAKRRRLLAAQALQGLAQLPEWIEPGLKAAKGWPDWHQALQAVHNNPDDAAARARLAYDELLANQLALRLLRARARQHKGQALPQDPARAQAFLASLPFKPTSAQQRAMAEIAQDMAKAQPMQRLLQGDVGSGKTVVALSAVVQAARAGVQAALLAPTDILARQHVENLHRLAQGMGLHIALLTGREKGRARQALLEQLAAGSIDLLVGTHALFSQDVVYANLGLVVVDEQHRFGVQQRLSLMAKGVLTPHLLVMTATPIPRTLSLTLYGELDVSVLNERPPGRLPIDTRVVDLARLEEVVQGLARALAQGAQAYWVCPLVEESELLDLAAAKARAEALKAAFGDQVGLLHGQMKSTEKQAVMQDFAAGTLRLLVATSVIEVGVDVPAASVMVIEHAERFGLAQLHQLRGRVGRGHSQSVCLLLRARHIGKIAQARLSLLREVQDGFYLAEEDLKLRGSGELLGLKQAGFPNFKLVDPQEHAGLIPLAHQDAQLLVDQDGALNSARGRAARLLLYVFERERAAALLRSG